MLPSSTGHPNQPPYSPPVPSISTNSTSTSRPYDSSVQRGREREAAEDEITAHRAQDEGSSATARKKPRFDSPDDDSSQKQRSGQPDPSFSTLGVGSFFPSSAMPPLPSQQPSSYRTTNSGANTPSQPSPSQSELSQRWSTTFPSWPLSFGVARSPASSDRSHRPSPSILPQQIPASYQPNNSTQSTSLVPDSRQPASSQSHLPSIPFNNSHTSTPPLPISTSHNPTQPSRYPSQGSLPLQGRLASTFSASAVASPHSELSPASSPERDLDPSYVAGRDADVEKLRTSGSKTVQREAGNGKRRVSATSERSTEESSAAGGSGEGGGSVNAGKTAFIGKLYHMLKDPQLKKLIAWTEGGETFFVSNPDDFAATACPLHFKHHNWQSFVRQLNMYGFSKVTAEERDASVPDSGGWEFRHPYFLEGQVELLQKIKRKAVKSDPKRPRLAPSPSSTIPDGSTSRTPRNVTASSTSSYPPSNGSHLAHANPASSLPGGSQTQLGPNSANNRNFSYPPKAPPHPLPPSRSEESLRPHGPARSVSSLAYFPHTAPPQHTYSQHPSSIHNPHLPNPQDTRNRMPISPYPSQYPSSRPSASPLASPYYSNGSHPAIPHRQLNILPPLIQGQHTTHGLIPRPDPHSISSSSPSSSFQGPSPAPWSPNIAEKDARISGLEEELKRERAKCLKGQIDRAEEIVGHLEDLNAAESAASKQRMLDSLKRIVQGHLAQAEAARSASTLSPCDPNYPSVPPPAPPSTHIHVSPSSSAAPYILESSSVSVPVRPRGIMMLLND